nr:hypothetical protein [Nostoc sp. CreGUA01]
MGGWGDGGMRKNNNRLLASFTPLPPYLPTSLPPHPPTPPTPPTLLTPNSSLLTQHSQCPVCPLSN